MKFMFALGETVSDKVTKFEGVVISRADHISGCNTYGVQPAALKDGVPQSCQWFDEPRLIGSGKVMPMVDPRTERTGADTVPQSTRSIG